MNHVTSLFAIICFALAISAQVPTNVGIQILKAEDARRYDKTLEDLMRSANADVRERAALAAGRTGREEAIPALTTLLTNDPSENVRVMAAFALGEIESTKAADAILNAIKTLETPAQEAETRPVGSVPHLTARLVEAAGKIAAANANAPQVRALQISIFDQLNAQAALGVRRNYQITLLGLTAALRAKREGVDIVVAKFSSDSDARIRADALNTLARLRSKQSLPEIRTLLGREADPIVRANAARVLGAAEDKDALELLLNAATADKDSRVRVAAIRALGNLKDDKAAIPLFEQLKILLTRNQKSKSAQTNEKSEILELVTVLGRLWQNSERNEFAEALSEFRWQDNASSPETEVAMARVSTNTYVKSIERVRISGTPAALLKIPMPQRVVTWRKSSSIVEGLAELAGSQSNKETAERYLRNKFLRVVTRNRRINTMAVPEVLRSMAKFKPSDINTILQTWLTDADVFNRATAAELLSDQPKTGNNILALKAAFVRAHITDKHDNDAQLAILDALYKLDKKESVGTLLAALNATDYLVRKKAFELLSEKELQKDISSLAGLLEDARKNRKDEVLPYDPKSGTKLGQVLNTDADYRRALERKNGSVKAVLTTEKGTFTIEFYPEQAPLTVDNFVKLARSGYFNGLEVHRVVPNFVMQDGDPRGDGNGGPGWSIRCEVNMLPYERGAVGMALSGKDTGGSQWFVTHSPQPHLDGGYTVFGRVSETDMKVVDSIVRGDKILTVKIIGR